MVRVLIVAAVAWLAILLVAPWLPAPLAAAVYAIGAMVCHQDPGRSFDLAGVQLPVCARCLGIYGGAATGALAAPRIGRLRSPRGAVLASVLPALVSLMVEWSGLGRPTNGIRAATGVLAGLVVAAVLLATLHYERCAPRRPTAPSLPPTLT